MLCTTHLHWNIACNTRYFYESEWGTGWYIMLWFSWSILYDLQTLHKKIKSQLPLFKHWDEFESELFRNMFHLYIRHWLLLIYLVSNKANNIVYKTSNSIFSKIYLHAIIICCCFCAIFSKKMLPSRNDLQVIQFRAISNTMVLSTCNCSSSQKRCALSDKISDKFGGNASHHEQLFL